jgi:hypothetical protein
MTTERGPLTPHSESLSLWFRKKLLKKVSKRDLSKTPHYQNCWSRQAETPRKFVIYVCPEPLEWLRIYKGLVNFSLINECNPPNPPKPLILNGWVYSNDISKHNEWNRTKLWAARNRCFHLTDSAQRDFYSVERMSTHAIGPLYSPLYLPWSFEKKASPCRDQLMGWLTLLRENWNSVAGLTISSYCQPVKFSGAKGRNLICSYLADSSPPWGGWGRLSSDEMKRRTFTILRKSVNDFIAPHVVDHIKFGQQ